MVRLVCETVSIGGVRPGNGMQNNRYRLRTD